MRAREHDYRRTPASARGGSRRSGRDAAAAIFRRADVVASHFPSHVRRARCHTGMRQVSASSYFLHAFRFSPRPACTFNARRCGAARRADHFSQRCSVLSSHFHLAAIAMFIPFPADARTCGTACEKGATPGVRCAARRWRPSAVHAHQDARPARWRRCSMKMRWMKKKNRRHHHARHRFANATLGHDGESPFSALRSALLLLLTPAKRMPPRPLGLDGRCQGCHGRSSLLLPRISGVYNVGRWQQKA